jgi:two-component system LytT family sensor kinase
MRKKRLYWTLQIIGWSLYLAVNLILVFLDPQGIAQTQRDLLGGYLSQIIDTGALFLGSHFILRKVIIQRDWLNINIGKIIFKLLLLILIAAVAAVIISALLNSTYLDLALDSSGLTNNFVFPAIASMVLYIIWVAIYFLFHYLESNNRSLKYEAAMNEMHLNQLKSQLNPHFIFNALNSMRALVDEEPKKAKVAITQLSNILRNSLITDMKRVVNFKNELDTVKDYLALESIRFEERLQVELDIAPASQYFDVPPMMLQTLTENAIKHGVSNLVSGGLIQIKTEIAGPYMTIKIRNSGQIKENGIPSRKSTRVGLENTQERLKLIYGDSASFKMYNENDKFVVAEVTIPQRM